MCMIKTIAYDNRQFASNTYIIGELGKNCVVVDPGQTGTGLLMFIKDRYQTISGILLTHGHFDHIRGLNALVDAYHCPIYIHKEDAHYLSDPRFNGSAQFGEPYTYDGLVHQVEDEELIHLEGHVFRVMHTPFHSPGSSCFIYEQEKSIFTGDTLFNRTIGRTDLIGSSERLIASSLAKFKQIDPSFVIYAGHGSQSTIANELKFNRFFLYI